MWQQMPANQNRLLDLPTIKEDICYNNFQLPVGQPVVSWKTPDPIPKDAILGKNCTIEELNRNHSEGLLEAFSADRQGKMWVYKSYGPFGDLASLENWIELIQDGSIVFAILDAATGLPIGTAGLVAHPYCGSARICHVNFAHKDTSAVAESVCLLMHLVFESG
jgi:hypothetical protein